MHLQSLDWENPLEEEMATHSGILAWKIPWTEEPGRRQSMESWTVDHDGCARMHTVGSGGHLSPPVHAFTPGSAASAPPILMKLLFGPSQEYYSLTSLFPTLNVDLVLEAGKMKILQLVYCSNLLTPHCPYCVIHRFREPPQLYSNQKRDQPTINILYLKYY